MAGTLGGLIGGRRGRIDLNACSGSAAYLGTSPALVQAPPKRRRYHVIVENASNHSRETSTVVKNHGRGGYLGGGGDGCWSCPAKSRASIQQRTTAGRCWLGHSAATQTR